MGENNSLDDIRANVNTTPPPKRGKGPLLILIGLVVVVALGVAAFATGMFGRAASKNQRVGEALSSVFEGEDNAFVSDWIGHDDLANNMARGYQVSGNMELVSLPALEGQGISLPKGVMLSFEGSSNAEAGASRGKMGFGLMGSSLVNAEFYMDQTKLQLAVPALFEEIIAADFSGDLAEKVKNAPLFKDEVDEETLQAIRSVPQALAESQELNEKMMQLAMGELKLSDYAGLENAMNKFRDSWTVVEAEAKTMTWNGSEDTFDGFDVTVAKEDLVAFMNDMKTYITTDEKFKEDFMDIIAGQIASREGISEEEAYQRIDTEMTEAISQFQADGTFTEAKFTVHMTRDNELVSLTSESRVEAATANILFERYGGDFPNQNMKAVVSVQGGEDPGQMEVVSSGKTEGTAQTRDFTVKSGGVKDGTVDIVMKTTLDKESGAFSGSVVTTGEAEGQPMDFTVDYKGTIEDVVKGKSATYVLDELKVMAQGEVQAELKGELKYSTEEVTVTPLEGAELDVFTATEEDMQGVMEQIMENIGVFMQFLDFGGGFGF